MECVINQKVGKLCRSETVSAKIKHTVSNNGCNAERKNQPSNKKSTIGAVIKISVQINKYAPNTPTKPSKNQNNLPIRA